MSNVYTAPTLSGYNDNAPPDDGSNIASNEVTWSGIKTKIGDPLKTQTDAMNSAITTAFGKLFLNAIEAESANYTVVTGDRGKLISCTNTITVTLLAAGSAGAGFALAVRNNGSGVITVDGNGSETINGQTTFTLYAGDMLVITCDGSNWEGMAPPSLDSDGSISLTSASFSGTVSSTKAAASGYTRVTPNLCRIGTDSLLGLTTLQSGAGTTNGTISAPSASATVVIVKVELSARALGSTGGREAFFYSYDDAGRTNLAKGIKISVQEMAATGYTSGNVITEETTELLIPLSTTGGTAYLTGTVTNNGFVGYKVVGYYD